MGTSHRQILRSSSIIGGSSVINILVGLFRTKAAALILGPSGVGLIGLIQNLLATASAISSVGLGNAGSRQVAEAVGRGDPADIAAARRALLVGTLVLATVGAAVFWMLRGTIATFVFEKDRFRGTVGWLAIGVALTVAFGSQNALLVGFRRVGDIARVSVLSSLLSTAIAIPALLLLGREGILFFTLSAPFSTFVIGWYFTSRVPRPDKSQTPMPLLLSQWRVMARVGSAIMVTSLAATGGELLVRTAVQRELGFHAVGQFQAAWVISMTYLSFVLAAMGADYYPRLAGSVDDHPKMNLMANEQSEVALLLAGPVLTAMMGMAPWVIQILYSSQFGDAAAILRWQILGDVLKIVSWPLGFMLLALGDGRSFVTTDGLSMATFVGLTWLGLPVLGLQATGLAFIGMFVVYLPVIHFLLRRRTGFRWQSRVVRKLVLVMLATGTTLIASYLNIYAGLAWSLVAASLLGLRAALTLEAALPAKLQPLVRFLRAQLLRRGLSVDD